MPGDNTLSEATERSGDACAEEKIHFPGSIQPHGILVGLDAQTFRLLVKSANLDELLPGTQPGEVPGWLPPEILTACGGLGRGGPAERIVLASIVGLGLTEIHCFVTGGVLFCEFETTKSLPVHPPSPNATLITAQMLGDLGRIDDIATLSAAIVEAVRLVSGFQRVLVYRFDDEENGEVLAESKDDDWQQSFLGLRFPASDIPAQARALYRMVGERWIPARDYQPVPLIPGHDAMGQPFDLGLSRFRSISAIHRLYQRNIDVDGAMSMSVLCDESLWGLVIGHHRRSHAVSTETRHQVVSLVQAFALRLDSLVKGRAVREMVENVNGYSAMLRKLAAADDFLSALTEGHPNILGLLPACTGAAVVWTNDGRPYATTLGDVPTQDDLFALTNWIQTTASGPIFATDRLAERFPSFAPYRQSISGVLSVSFEDSRQPVMLLFRPEIVQSVSWAGKPEKIAGPDNVPNLPRRSFDRWVEIKRGLSQPWSPSDRDIAATICATVNDVIVRQTRRVQELAVDVARLNLSNLRNRLLLKLASDGVFVLDAAGSLIESSDSFCQMLGYACDEMVGMHVSAWDINYSSDGCSRALYQTPTEAKILKFETYHRKKNGSLLMVEVTNIPLELDGKVVLYNASRDITERKQAETVLHFIATTMESPESTVICDASGVILRANQSFSNITGYSQKELVGCRTNLLKSGHHDATFYAAMWQALSLKGSWFGEIWNRRKNGEVYSQWLNIRTVKGPDGVISHYVGSYSDFALRKESEERNKELAFYDPLTGLANRRLLMDRVDQALASGARSRCEGALLLVNLDRFKVVNDTGGYVVGDLLLQQVAQRLVDGFPEADSLARNGADEFVVVIGNLDGNPEMAAIQAEKFGQRLLADFERPYRVMECDYHVTASIGIALFAGRRRGFDSVMKQAETAMYKAKAAGRGTLHLFDQALRAAVSLHIALESDLRQGLDAHQFAQYYQPQWYDGKVVAAEALLRWRHPQRGWLASTEFIAVAEESGQILPLGAWALESACRQSAAWAGHSGLQDLALVVNVSVTEICHAKFVDRTLGIMRESGADPQGLILEVTEGIFGDHSEDIIRKMFILKSQGIGLSLDHFGKGRSSLFDLKRLAPDQVKIDQAIVHKMLSNPNNATIARTIINLAQMMNFEVIAEGVETEEQREQLTSYGCRGYQGYLFSKPVPLEKFEQMLPL